MRLAHLAIFCCCLGRVADAAWTFTKTSGGGGAGTRTLAIHGVGAGAFDPARMSNWLRDGRAPLIAAKAGGNHTHPVPGLCPANIYNVRNSMF